MSVCRILVSVHVCCPSWDQNFKSYHTSKTLPSKKQKNMHLYFLLGQIKWPNEERFVGDTLDALFRMFLNDTKRALSESFTVLHVPSRPQGYFYGKLQSSFRSHTLKPEATQKAHYSLNR